MTTPARSENGIVTIQPAIYPVDATVEKLKGILRAEGSQIVRLGGSQRGGGKGRHADASHQAR